MLYDEMYGTSISIYRQSEKEFINSNPICKKCLVQSMCIQKTDSGYGIKVRVCEELFVYFQKVKKDDKNLIKFK